MSILDHSTSIDIDGQAWLYGGDDAARTCANGTLGGAWLAPGTRALGMVMLVAQLQEVATISSCWPFS